MPPFDIRRSIVDADRRLGAETPTRTRAARSDAGKSRLAPDVAQVLTTILRSQEKPAMRDVQQRLAAECARLGQRVPARATIYHFMDQCCPRQVRIADLPQAVRDCLYNLDPAGTVPGHQLAFYALNYGGVQAMSFAAGMPWLDLHQANRMRGWRPQSHAVLRAIMVRRGI